MVPAAIARVVPIITAATAMTIYTSWAIHGAAAAIIVPSEFPMAQTAPHVPHVIVVTDAV